MANHQQTDPVLIIIGRNIRRWREFREISGETLARAVQMDKSQISKIENGRSLEISVQAIEKIASALDLAFAQLIFTSPQTLIAITQSLNINGVNQVSQNNTDSSVVDELRQQLKAKDDHIKLLQSQIRTK